MCRILVALLLLLIVGTAGARHPLEPADTSSPHATIESFFLFSPETVEGARCFYLKVRELPHLRPILLATTAVASTCSRVLFIDAESSVVGSKQRERVSIHSWLLNVPLMYQ